MRKRSARLHEAKKSRLPQPTEKEIEDWRLGRRKRFDQFRRAWVSTQPHGLVSRTVWEFKTRDGLITPYDVTPALARMVDFVCVITGVSRLMIPPTYKPDTPLKDLLPEGLTPDERAIFEATCYFGSPHIFIDEDVKFPQVIINCVTEKLHRELTLFFGHPSLYQDPLYESIEDDDEEFYHPRIVDTALVKYPKIIKQIEDFERQEFQMPGLSRLEPTYETAGGLLGNAEKRCLAKAIKALDGITPGTNDWWSLPKQGPLAFYNSASGFRFVLYEALLWWSTKNRPFREVTAADSAHYLKHFERMVSSEHVIYNKLREFNLPRWSSLKSYLIELIECNQLS